MLAAGFGYESNAKVFRLLRMLRILKLMRIIRASRIIRRWQDHVSVSYAVVALWKFCFITIILAHWMACYWGYLGAENDDPWRGYGAGQSWRQKAGIPADTHPAHVYGLSLYVALNNIFGGSCEINSATYHEFYAQVVMLLIGSSVWAYIIGSACGIIATLDPAGIEFRQTMDEINFFARDQMLPKELTVRIRSYFRNTVHLIRARRYHSLLQKMSTRLRGDAAYRMCEFRLSNVPYLVDSDLEPEFMCSLAIKYSMAVYSRLERIPCTDLFVVDRGLVAKRGRLGLAADCFGKDVILSNDALRDLGDAIALTFVQTISLTQKDIFELLPDYPRAYHIVRKAALRMALSRALLKAAQILKRMRVADQKDKTLAGVFDELLLDLTMASEKEKAEVERKRQQYIPMSLTNQPVSILGVRLKSSATAAAAAGKQGGQSFSKQKWGAIGSVLGKKGRAGNLRLFLEKDEFKPPTVEDRIKMLSDKVDASQVQVLRRVDAFEGEMRTLMHTLIDKIERTTTSKEGLNEIKRNSSMRRRQRLSQDMLAGSGSGNACMDASCSRSVLAEAGPAPRLDRSDTSSTSLAVSFASSRVPSPQPPPLPPMLPPSPERQELREAAGTAMPSRSSPFDA